MKDSAQEQTSKHLPTGVIGGASILYLVAHEDRLSGKPSDRCVRHLSSRVVVGEFYLYSDEASRAWNKSEFCQKRLFLAISLYTAVDSLETLEICRFSNK
jgi:hypothetical protein